MDDRLAREAVDGAGAASADTVLRDPLRTRPFAEVSVPGVQCRATLCRVDLAFSGPEAPGETVQELPAELPWPSSALSAPHPDRPDVPRVFRSGEGLPLAEGNVG